VFSISSLFGKDKRAEQAKAEAEALAVAQAAAAQRPSISSTELLGRTIVATIVDPILSAGKIADLQVELFFKMSSRPDLRNIVFDFQNVEFVDSACLGMMVQLLRRVREKGGKVAIANVNSRIESLFKLTRLEQLFLMKRDVLDAVSAVER